jgi:hypothetical protein
VLALAVMAGCAHDKAKEQPKEAAQEKAAEPAKAETTAPAEKPAEKPAELSEKPQVEASPVEKVKVEAPAAKPLEIKQGKDTDPPPGLVMATFDEMKLDKSPTFGVVYRNWVIALYNRDYDAAWAMLSAKQHDKLDSQLKQTIEQCGTSVHAAQLMMSRTNSEAGRAQLRANIKYWEALAPELQKLDARQFFTWVFERYESRSGNNPSQPYLLKPHEWTGEEIAGDAGTVNIKAFAPNDKLTFAKDKGEWKVDYTPFTPEQSGQVLAPPQ